MDARSEKNLVGVHPDLAGVIRTAWGRMQGRPDKLGFVVIEGLRTKARQAQLVAAGASQTMNGRHLSGHAVVFLALPHGASAEIAAQLPEGTYGITAMGVSTNGTRVPLKVNPLMTVDGVLNDAGTWKLKLGDGKTYAQSDLKGIY
jgi:hypothetical protein